MRSVGGRVPLGPSDQLDTVTGQVIGIDRSAGRLHIATLYEVTTLFVHTLYFEEANDLVPIRSLQVGDGLIAQLREETSRGHSNGTARKLLLNVTILSPDEMKRTVCDFNDRSNIAPLLRRQESVMG